MGSAVSLTARYPGAIGKTERKRPIRYNIKTIK